MKVRLDYGDRGLVVDIPEHAVVVEPQPRVPLRNPEGAMRSALSEPTAGPPLADLATRGATVAISVCDGTRPQPREPMVKTILGELRKVGAADSVTILVATGTHRGNTPEELERMLGAEVMETCTVVNHDCRDESNLVDLGTVAGDVPVALNRRWVEADLRITTGFVEPHFFAGFSGGPKMVAPGLAALETVMALHNAKRIADRRATWGIVEGNPVHDAIRQAAGTCAPQFSMDVLLNLEKQVTDVFAGDLWEMHRVARESARAVAMQEVDRRFPIVVTTNSGFPLDQNLYQAVKGISAAAQIVEPGGTIICAAECRDGLPNGGVYAELLSSAPTISEVNDRILASDAVTPDQWQVQVQARVQQTATVMVYATGLTHGQIRSAHMTPVDDVDATIRDLMGSHTNMPVAVLPAGPQTIAFLA